MLGRLWFFEQLVLIGYDERLVEIFCLNVFEQIKLSRQPLLPHVAATIKLIDLHVPYPFPAPL